VRLSSLVVLHGCESDHQLNGGMVRCIVLSYCG
jgi:hypothetical protein